MDIIPVLDIMKGKVVHGKSGKRETYQPLVSILTQSHDPVIVAKDLVEKLKVESIYVADLDAIKENKTSMNEMAKIFEAVKGKVLLDAGISQVERIKELKNWNNVRIVIGTETITTLSQFDALAQWGSDKLTISLDFKHDRLVTKCQELSEWNLNKIFKHLTVRGFNDFILLDLDAVGTEKGVNTKNAELVLSLYPQIHLILGGGVANTDDLLTLEKAGLHGVLLGTALHKGAITQEDVQAIMVQTI